MRPVRIKVWLGCIAALLLGMASPAFGLDRIGQTGVPATRLGQRIAEHSSPAGAASGTASYWNAVIMAITVADPASDARADGRSGHPGFMTYANDTVAERYVASGLRCRDRSEPRRRKVFHFGYQAPLSADAGRALLAFDAYARAYNAQVLSAGALKETSCIPVTD